jgi:hypothetical protein
MRYEILGAIFLHYLYIYKNDFIFKRIYKNKYNKYNIKLKLYFLSVFPSLRLCVKKYIF